MQLDFYAPVDQNRFIYKETELKPFMTLSRDKRSWSSFPLQKDELIKTGSIIIMKTFVHRNGHQMYKLFIASVSA
jgi:hypothetical protein